MGILEILVILLVAFIFLGPERMMDAARFLARAAREGRNLASSIPRVVVEDDDVKVVQDGRATSLTKQDADGATTDTDDDGRADGAVSSSRTAAAESQPPAADIVEDSGPVPFSRRRSPAPPPPAPADRDDGQQR